MSTGKGEVIKQHIIEERVRRRRVLQYFKLKGETTGGREDIFSVREFGTKNILIV